MSNVEDILALSFAKTQARMTKQGATHLTLANLRPAFIIFEDIILHVGSKDKDEKMPLHHGIHPCVNKHQSLVDF
jgi:hypothetical protein